MKQTAFFLLLFSALALALPLSELPESKGYANDFAGVLSSGELSDLNFFSQQIEKNTSVEIATVLIDSTDGMPISDYAFGIGNAWRVGKKEVFNGVVILIAVEDRKWFIATAKGIEGDLPDVLTSRIANNAFPQNFKQGKYYEGIRMVLEAFRNSLSGNVAEQSIDKRNFDKIAVLVLVLLLFLVGFLIFRIVWLKFKAITSGHRNGAWASDLHGGWSGGGGFGGGGWGGFGGGGGFSGGGSGGSW